MNPGFHLPFFSTHAAVGVQPHSADLRVVDLSVRDFVDPKLEAWPKTQTDQRPLPEAPRRFRAATVSGADVVPSCSLPWNSHHLLRPNPPDPPAGRIEGPTRRNPRLRWQRCGRERASVIPPTLGLRFALSAHTRRCGLRPPAARGRPPVSRLRAGRLAGSARNH